MGPSRSPSPLAGDAAQLGQGQGEMGSEPRTCGVTAEKGRNLLVPGMSGPGAGAVSTHRAMPVCSAGELGMNSCKNNNNKKKKPTQQSGLYFTFLSALPATLP